MLGVTLTLVGGVVAVAERDGAVVLAEDASGGVEGTGDVRRVPAPIGTGFPVAGVEDRGAGLPGAGILHKKNAIIRGTDPFVSALTQGLAVVASRSSGTALPHEKT